MQATIWYLFGIVLGTSLYGLFVYFGVSFNPNKPSLAGFSLLLFFVPYALMQIGLLCFVRATWILAPQFLRRTRPFELRRRVQQ